MTTNVLHPVVTPKAEMTFLRQLGGEETAILLTGEETGGNHALVLDCVPPGEGPPLHIHHNEDETFFVLEGELEIMVDGRRISAKAGDMAFLPRGIAHTFWNPGQVMARSLVLLTPAGLENFFVDVAELVKAGKSDLPTVIAVAESYGAEVVGPPLAAMNGAS